MHQNPSTAILTIFPGVTPGPWLQGQGKGAELEKGRKREGREETGEKGRKVGIANPTLKLVEIIDLG